MILGIDPAKEGAAVLLDDTGQAIHVWSWKECQRNKETRYKVTHTKAGVNLAWEHITTPQGIANLINLSVNDLDGIVCEQAYVNKKFPLAGIQVARFGGIVSGGVAAQSLRTRDIDWITASNWRYDLLRLPHFTKREQCKIASLTMVPKLCISINHHMELHGNLDHITDACGVAIWLLRRMP